MLCRVGNRSYKLTKVLIERKMLVERKVGFAADMLNEALKPRRRAKPGELVRYISYSEEGGEDCRMGGVDMVEMTRNKEPSIFLKLLQKWMFTREILRLPNDAQYMRNLERFLERERKKEDA